ncbi:SLAF1 protein, partial [Hirundo rustica]|nr:SLAF1 protein [Hirundo rustica]
EGQQTKKFLLKLSGRNYTEYEPGRMRFHSQDFSLEILNTSRDDRQLYEYSVSSGEEEEVWQILLEVFEAVAAPSIRILAWELSNGSCSVALRCSSERGDDVSYSWAGPDGGSGSGPCSGSGAFLNLSFPQRSAAPGCSCTASNRVSSRRAAAPSRACGSRQ